MDTVNDSLSMKTKEFWRLSSAFNGHPVPDAPTVSEASKQLRELAFVLGPHRKLLRTKINCLREDIIKHGNKRKASIIQGSKVLQMNLG